MKNRQSLSITEKDLYNELWIRGNLRFKLWPQQIKIYEIIKELPIDIQMIVVECARQFGKSVLGALLMLEDCLRNPGVTVLVVGPEIKQARAIVNPRLKLLSGDAPEGLITQKKAEDRWIVGHSEIVLGGFDVKNASRQRGKTLYKIYIEEIVDSSPDTFNEFIRSDLAPALIHSPDAKIQFNTTPPKIPDHPYLIDIVPQAKIDGSFFQFTIDDNEKLSDQQKENIIRLCGGRNSVEAQRELWCRVVRDPHVVIVPDFDEQKHVCDLTLPQKRFMEITADWGGVRDFTCLLLHSYDFLSNKYIILDELVFPPNTATSKIKEAAKPWQEQFGLNFWHADVPGQLQIDLMEDGDLEVRIPPKADWKAAVNRMAVVFTLDQILIDRRCKYLIQNCNSGRFNKQKTDFERSAALGHCDGLAALMYAVRVQNTSNPYSETVCSPMGQNQFGLPKAKESSNLAETLVPWVAKGSQFKRFGTFRKSG